MDLLLVDIGNTAVKWVFTPSDHFEVLLKRVYPTGGKGWLRELEKDFFEYRPFKVVVSSVKPSLVGELKRAIPAAAVVKNEELSKLIKVEYKNLSTLGTDRLLNALGGLNYADTFLVISVGTALVVDLVYRGIFKGGSIALGPQKELECLFTKAEMLPKLEVLKAVPPPGNSTESSILSGVLWSLKFTVEGFVRYYRSRYGVDKVLLTGGGAKLALELLEENEYFLFRKDLLFEGLYKYAKGF